MLEFIYKLFYKLTPFLKGSVESSPHREFLEYFYTHYNALPKALFWVVVAASILACLYYFVLCRTRFFSKTWCWFLFLAISFFGSVLISSSIIIGAHWPDDTTFGVYTSLHEQYEELRDGLETEDELDSLVKQYWACRTDVDEDNVPALRIPVHWDMWASAIWFSLFSIVIRRYSKYGQNTP